MTDSNSMSPAEKEAYITPGEAGQPTPFHEDPSVAPLLGPPDSSGLPGVVRPTEAPHSTTHGGLDPIQKLLDKELAAERKLFKHSKDSK